MSTVSIEPTALKAPNFTDEMQKYDVGRCMVPPNNLRFAECVPKRDGPLVPAKFAVTAYNVPYVTKWMRGVK